MYCKIPLVKKLFSYAILFSFSCFITAVYPADHDKQMVMATKSGASKNDVISIAVLAYENMVLQDFSGPIEVFSKANNLTHGRYQVFTVGLNKSSFHTENKIVNITPEYTFETMPAADYFIIPGAGMSEIESLIKNTFLRGKITNWNKKKNAITVSICTASYLLANTDALRNRKATTHYFVADDFSKRFPDIDVVKNVRFIDSGDYITSSGVTSGIDVALYIVGQRSGNNIKNMISRALQYTYHEEENWPVAPMGMKYESKLTK